MMLHKLPATRDVEQLSVDIEDAGRMLGYKRAAAYQKFVSGEIPGAFKVGKTWRVSVEILRGWVKQQTANQSLEQSPLDSGRAANNKTS